MINNLLWKLKQALGIRLVDTFAPLKGQLSENGYFIIENVFNEKDLDSFLSIKSELDKQEQECPEKLYYAVEQPMLLSAAVTKFLENKFVSDLVTSYLGSSARFDFCNAWRCNQKSFEESNSGKWHHDSVGYRLKFFVLLSDTAIAGGQPTHVLPGTHKYQYLDFSTNGSRINVNESSLVELRGKFGDILVFDTNMLHRGVYNTGGKSRDIIQFEYSSKYKSNLITGEIGPRNTYFPSSCDFNKLYMVDKSRLCQHKNYILYN